MLSRLCMLKIALLQSHKLGHTLVLVYVVVIGHDAFAVCTAFGRALGCCDGEALNGAGFSGRHTCRDGDLI